MVPDWICIPDCSQQTSHTPAWTKHRAQWYQHWHFKIWHSWPKIEMLFSPRVCHVCKSIVSRDSCPLECSLGGIEEVIMSNAFTWHQLTLQLQCAWPPYMSLACHICLLTPLTPFPVDCQLSGLLCLNLNSNHPPKLSRFLKVQILPETFTDLWKKTTECAWYSNFLFRCEHAQ